MGYLSTREALTVAQLDRDRAKADRDRAKAAATSEAAARRESDARKQQAEEAKQNAERTLYYARIGLAQQKWIAAEVDEAERILDACPQGLRGWEWGYLKHLCHLDVRRLAATRAGSSAWRSAPTAGSW